MAVLLRWANVGNVAVSLVMLVLGLAILALGAAATTEYLNAIKYKSNTTDLAYGQFLFITGTAHYIIAATVLIPASLGLAGGITGNKAVYILYAVMGLLTFVAFVALFAWHCATCSTGIPGQPNILNITSYPEARGMAIAFIALDGTMIMLEIIAISFGFIAICWRPPSNDFHKYGGGSVRPPPSYPYREPSVFRATTGVTNPASTDYDERGIDMYRASIERHGGEIYQPWETRFGENNRRSQH